MKVECKISTDYKEPYAVLHVNRMTQAIAEDKSCTGSADIEGGRVHRPYGSLYLTGAVRKMVLRCGGG